MRVFLYIIKFTQNEFLLFSFNIVLWQFSIFIR